MGVGIPFTRHIFAVTEKGEGDMARYIDADALLKYIKDIPTWYEEFGIGWHATKYPNGSYDCEDIINSILNARAADVVPRSEVVREIFEELGEYASDFAEGCIDGDQFLQAFYNVKAKHVDVVRCQDCKYLMFSDHYGECSKGYRGIVSPEDSCEHGEKKI